MQELVMVLLEKLIEYIKRLSNLKIYFLIVFLFIKALFYLNSSKL